MGADGAHGAPPAEAPRLTTFLRSRAAASLDVDEASVGRAAALSAASRQPSGAASAARGASVAPPSPLARRLFSVAPGGWAAAPRAARDAHTLLLASVTRLLGGETLPTQELHAAAAAAYDTFAAAAARDAAAAAAGGGGSGSDANVRRAAAAAETALKDALRAALGVIEEQHIGATSAAAAALRRAAEAAVATAPAAAASAAAAATAPDGAARAAPPPPLPRTPAAAREFGAELTFAPPRPDERLHRQARAHTRFLPLSSAQGCTPANNATHTLCSPVARRLLPLPPPPPPRPPLPPAPPPPPRLRPPAPPHQKVTPSSGCASSARRLRLQAPWAAIGKPLRTSWQASSSPRALPTRLLASCLRISVTAAWRPSARC
jgi:hypothetical protein